MAHVCRRPWNFDALHASGLDQLPELPRADVVHLQRFAQMAVVGVFLREDEAMIVVVPPVLHLDLRLRDLVGLQAGDRVGRQAERARLPRLRRPELRRRSALAKVATDRQPCR